MNSLWSVHSQSVSIRVVKIQSSHNKTNCPNHECKSFIIFSFHPALNVVTASSVLWLHQSTFYWMVLLVSEKLFPPTGFQLFIISAIYNSVWQIHSRVWIPLLSSGSQAYATAFSYSLYIYAPRSPPLTPSVSIFHVSLELLFLFTHFHTQWEGWWTMICLLAQKHCQFITNIQSPPRILKSDQQLHTNPYTHAVFCSPL